MHSSNLDGEGSGYKDVGEVLVMISTLVTEGRIPGTLNSKTKKFYEGPHCSLAKQAQDHKCDLEDPLCVNFKNNKATILQFWKQNIPLCVEVYLNCACKDNSCIDESLENYILLEQWYFSINSKRSAVPLFFNFQQLMSAVRSQLYFSQVTAWLTSQDDNSPTKIGKNNLTYHFAISVDNISTKFSVLPVIHEFPLTDIGNGYNLGIKFLSLPRMSSVPNFTCINCLPTETAQSLKKNQEMDQINRPKSDILDDRMHTSCTLKGKHRCEDLEEYENVSDHHKKLCNKTVFCHSEPSTSSHNHNRLRIDTEKTKKLNESEPKAEKRNISLNFGPKSKSVKFDSAESACYHNLDLKNKGQMLLDAIERSGQKCKGGCIQKKNKSGCDIDICDMSESDIFSIRKNNYFNIYVDKHCDSPIPKFGHRKNRDISNVFRSVNRTNAKKKITFEETSTTDIRCGDGKTIDIRCRDGSAVGVDIPTPLEQAKFRKNLDNAASMVFHSRTGLPLTSSPAPVRRGKSCFDFDSSINSVSAIKSALFSSSFSTDDESESDGSIISPCSPEIFVTHERDVTPIKYRRKGHAANLLGSFEESVLNGRLEPVSTVHGFRAELGASGSFVPKHLIVPVTVFFYTLGDNDKVSSPYLSHINLGKKGYNVPRSGSVQVTLFNPLGTVVKMFVIMYDLSDMPPNSQTFIRQRTLYMPTKCKEDNLEWGPKWLRFIIHLRFMSSKSGKIYLHSDIRMIIFRKTDMDTAAAHGIDMSYELRSFTHMPTNPKFSPRK